VEVNRNHTKKRVMAESTCGGSTGLFCRTSQNPICAPYGAERESGGERGGEMTEESVGIDLGGKNYGEGGGSRPS